MGDLTRTRSSTLEDRLRAVAGRFWPWFALTAVLLTVQVKWWWEPGPDAASYLSIARNMAEGRLQRFDSAHVRYAPAYAALLAPTFLVSDEPFLLISLVQLGIALVLAAGTYAWLRQLAPAVAGLLMALVFVNASLWEHYRMTHSETAFMAAVVWATYSMRRMTQVASPRQTALWAALAALITLAACLTRQAGLVLLPGLAIALWQSPIRRARALALLAAVSAPVVLGVWTLILWDRGRAEAAGPQGKAYHEYMLDPQSTLPAQIAEGVRLRISECGRLLLPGMSRTYARSGEWLNINVLLFTAAAAAGLVGWWRLVWRHPDPLLWAAPFYVALYVVWPFDQGTRYMLPLLPVLWLCVWRLVEGWQSRRFLFLTAGAALHAAVAVGLFAAEWDASPGRQWKELASVSAPLRQMPGEAAVVGLDVRAAHIVAVQSNRKVRAVKSADQLGPEVPWAITAGARLTGFELRGRSSEFCLLQRSAPQVARRKTNPEEGGSP
jgi:hypothetical protein